MFVLDGVSFEKEFFYESLDLLCIAGLEGNFIKVNKAWERILGYSIEELEKRNFLEFIHPEDIQATINAMTKLGNKEDIINFVNRYRCSDGSYRYIEWKSQNYEGLIYAVSRDITDRKRVEDSLRLSEEKYRGLFEKMVQLEALCTKSNYGTPLF